ncbi:MAG: hypothetical protein GY820_04130 [Gammaproteobacteria bacterium]|nr:hypothetical protein [Gammaproteobacteria bacterium]
MISHKTKLAFTIAIAVGACPMLAHATNGMNSEGSGPKSRGMGGAGVAIANEAQSIINNPAAVTALGNRRDMAMGLFSPNERGYEVSGNPAFGGALNRGQTSDKNYFPIPFYGFSKALGDGAAWAFTISAAGGMNTDYDLNFAEGAFTGSTGINLAQMFFGGTYGAELADGMSWGVTISLAYQQFAAEGLDLFDQAGYTSAVGSVTNNGTDASTGIGLKVGMMGPLGEGSWGASYQMKTDMSEFDDYAGLFANQGDLDIAPTLTIGVAYPVGDGMTLAVDYHHIDYEAVDTISNATALFNPGVLMFGDTNGPGFGWKSISVIKAGIEVQTSEDMIWRGGINYGESPLNEDDGEFSTAFLVPATITTHLTAGFTMKLDANSELTGVFVRSLENSQSGDFSSTFGGGTMDASMEQNFLEISYGTNF